MTMTWPLRSLALAANPMSAIAVEGCPFLSSRIRSTSRPLWGVIEVNTSPARAPSVSVGSSVRARAMASFVNARHASP